MSTPEDSSSQAGSPEIAVDVLACIAAAVATMFPRPHRILAISTSKYGSEQLLQWSWEGRRDVYSSHRFR